MGKFTDLKDSKFGEWTVLEYIGKSYWKCKCSCGTEKNILGYTLTHGLSTNCGHNTNKFIDLSNKRFGSLTVEKYINNKGWLCKCDCGNKFIRSSYYLRHQIFNNECTCNNSNKLIDLSNMEKGLLKVVEYVGDGKWKCICSCGTICTKSGKYIRNTDNPSCGCNTSTKIKGTILDRYGETSPVRASNPRESWQIDIFNDREKLYKYIKSFGYKPTTNDLACKLNVCISALLKRIHLFNIEDCIDIDAMHSKYEDDIVRYIKRCINEDIVIGDRNILTGKELDIYIPSHNLAIEFNGNYWHSDIKKVKKYHQQKTIACAKQGIRLVHIFEYEYTKNKDKILNYIHNILCDGTKIYARNTYIKEISQSDADNFINKFHLQNSINSSIRLGCFYKDELIGVMTFGKPRFNNNYRYELYRLCWKDSVHVIGGIEKLFKYFIREYNPYSIITYCDISKFTGNSYYKLGFKPIQPKPITEPNYVWVDDHCKEVINRYQTQKHKLVEKGICRENETEDECMRRLGFLKVYDSGNIVLHYIKSD